MPILTKTGFAQGIWTGVLSAIETDGGADAAETPALEAVRDGEPVPGLELQAVEAGGDWEVRFQLPAEALGDGLWIYEIRLDEQTLAEVTVMSGDLRGELLLLRTELEMVKRVLRQMGDKG